MIASLVEQFNALPRDVLTIGWMLFIGTSGLIFGR